MGIWKKIALAVGIITGLMIILLIAVVLYEYWSLGNYLASRGY